MTDKFPDVDWYCDNCSDYLNDQDRFDSLKYLWKDEGGQFWLCLQPKFPVKL